MIRTIERARQQTPITWMASRPLRARSTRWVARRIALLAMASVIGALSLPLPVAAPGDIFVTDPYPGRVIRVDPATGATTVVAREFGPTGGPRLAAPSGIAIAADGDLIVVNNANSIIRVNPSTGARTTISDNANPAGGPSLTQAHGIAIAANGDVIVIDSGASGEGAVIRVDPTTGARTTVVDNTNPALGPPFTDPRGVAVAANGDLFVTARSAGTRGVLRIDPATGAHSLVANTLTAGGGAEGSPYGIAVAASGDLIVTDPYAGGPDNGPTIFRINATTGARSIISDNANPAGDPKFYFPQGIAITADGALIVVDEGMFTGNGSVDRVDPITGARSWISTAADTDLSNPEWIAIERDVSTTAPPPAPAPPAPPPPLFVPPPFAAKFEVKRADILRAARRLSVLAPITSHASGQVKVAFEAAGTTERFTANVDAAGRRVRIDRRISER